MKKRLLFAFAMLLTATFGFAQAIGDYVYTNNGKFKITAEKVSGLVNADFTGWTAITATEGTAVADIFTYNNGFQALKTAVTEGISYSVSTLDANTDYVASFQITQEAATTPNYATHVGYCDHIKGDANICMLNIKGINLLDETDVVECAKAVMILPGEPQTYSFGIAGDGVAREYRIELCGWADAIVINDIKIQEATRVGDDRLVTPYLDHAKQIKALRTWDASDYLDALNENIEFAEACLANPDVEAAEIEGALEGLKESIADFQNNCMDAQLTSDEDKILLAAKKVQKVSNIGVWQGWGAGNGRVHANQGERYDVGHYAGNTTWGYGDGCIGLVFQTELQPGSYVFSLQQRAGMREKSTSSCWDVNQGLEAIYSAMYIRTLGSEEEEAAISHFNADYEQSKALAFAKTTLHATDDKKVTISVNITEAGTYEFGVKTYALDNTKDMKNGGTFEPYDAQIFAKTDAKYSKAEYDYEADVVEQITAARTNITTANEALAGTAQPWGKAELKAAVDACEPVTAAYELLTEDEIIATFDKNMYDKAKGLEVINEDYTTETDTVYYRLLASEVYRLATKGIIAANKAFTAKNDTLASLDKAIAAASAALKYRIYDYATAKPALVSAIESAKALYASLFAGEYSEENAQTILATIDALAAAIDDMKASIPADKVTVLADIDFEAAPYVDPAAGDPAVQNVEATFNGNVNSMLVNNYTSLEIPDGNMGNAAQVGFLENGATILPGILHLGKADGIVELDSLADYGTDVLRVSMDFWFGNLSGKSAGFYLKDANEQNIGGIFLNRYNGTTDYDPTGIFALGGITGLGSSSVSNAGICVETNLTKFEYVLDYGTKKAYCTTINGSKGTFTSELVDFSGAAVAKFVLTSNYNNDGRRCWFDNLKIERIQADPASGIAEVAERAKVQNSKIYTISGMEVQKAVKGVYIINGKKVVK